jgi:hypothetical protein
VTPRTEHASTNLHELENRSRTANA